MFEDFEKLKGYFLKINFSSVTLDEFRVKFAEILNKFIEILFETRRKVKKTFLKIVLNF